jgi:hypothetical protein
MCDEFEPASIFSYSKIEQDRIMILQHCISFHLSKFQSIHVLFVVYYFAQLCTFQCVSHSTFVCNINSKIFTFDTCETI